MAVSDFVDLVEIFLGTVFILEQGCDSGNCIMRFEVVRVEKDRVRWRFQIL